jgi:hypothetical protein
MGWRARRGGRRSRAECIQPLAGASDEKALNGLGGVTFDAVVSNTVDRTNPFGHLAAMRVILDKAIARSEAAGHRPLVIFSIAPHTEGNPLVPSSAFAILVRVNEVEKQTRFVARDFNFSIIAHRRTPARRWLMLSISTSYLLMAKPAALVGMPSSESW